MGNYCHPGKDAVFGLCEIVGFRIAVNIGMDLIDPWKGMKDFHCLLCVHQHFVTEDIDIFDLFIFNRIYKPLFLNTRHVNNIGSVNNIGELCMFEIPYSLPGKMDFVFIGQSKFGWCNEIKNWIFKLEQGHNQAVYRPSVFQVTYQK